MMNVVRVQEMSIATDQIRRDVTTKQELPEDLFTRFVAYVDRGQKTTETYLTNLRQFAAWIAFKGIRSPQREDILAFGDYLMSVHEEVRLDSTSLAGWTIITG